MNEARRYYELRELISKYEDSLPQALIVELKDIFFKVHKWQSQAGVNWNWVWSSISRLLQNYYKSLPAEIQEVYDNIRDIQEQNTPLPWL
jgi:hypothetical protein